MEMNTQPPEQPRSSPGMETSGLQTGMPAPDFELPDADMRIARLDDFRERQHVVLFFYIRDHTPACTAEAIEFSDLEADFARCGCQVLGVSRDDCISHGEFRDRQGIGVRLLADRELIASRAYGVMRFKDVDGMMRETAQRATFVIDKHGIVRHALYGVNAKGHAVEVLELVKEL